MSLAFNLPTSPQLTIMNAHFGDRLLRLRKLRGWSREELSRQVTLKGGDVTVQAIKRYEDGKTKTPSDETKKSLALALDVSVMELMGLEGDWLNSKEESFVRASGRILPPAYKEFLHDSPLAHEISAEESDILTSIHWPMDRIQPTRNTYEQFLLVLRNATARSRQPSRSAKR